MVLPRFKNKLLGQQSDGILRKTGKDLNHSRSSSEGSTSNESLNTGGPHHEGLPDDMSLMSVYIEDDMTAASNTMATLRKDKLTLLSQVPIEKKTPGPIDVDSMIPKHMARKIEAQDHRYQAYMTPRRAAPPPTRRRPVLQDDASILSLYIEDSVVTMGDETHAVKSKTSIECDSLFTKQTMVVADGQSPFARFCHSSLQLLAPGILRRRLRSKSYMTMSDKKQRKTGLGAKLRRWARSIKPKKSDEAVSEDRKRAQWRAQQIASKQSKASMAAPSASFDFSVRPNMYI